MGRNVRIDYRWGAGVADLYRRYAAELITLAPDVILASGVPAVSAVQQTSRTMPVVFVDTTDPVAAGFVASLSRPGGYATGFTQFEFGMSGKWLELLKEIAPWRYPRRRHSQSDDTRRVRPTGSHPGGSTLIQGRDQPD